MHAVAFPSHWARPVPAPVLAYDSRDADDAERMGRMSAVWALLEDIKAREPTRNELIRVIDAACGAP